MCPFCRGAPSVLICDGKTLRMQTRRTQPGGSPLHEVHTVAEDLARTTLYNLNLHILCVFKTPAHMRYLETHEVNWTSEVPFVLQENLGLWSCDPFQLEGVVSLGCSDYLPRHTRFLLWEHEAPPSQSLLDKTGVSDGGLVLFTTGGKKKAWRGGCRRLGVTSRTFDVIKQYVVESPSAYTYLRLRNTADGHVRFFRGELANTGSCHTGMRSYDVFGHRSHSSHWCLRGTVNEVKQCGHDSADGKRLQIEDLQDPRLVLGTFLCRPNPATVKISNPLHLALGPVSLQAIVDVLDMKAGPSTQLYAYVQESSTYVLLIMVYFYMLLHAIIVNAWTDTAYGIYQGW